MVLSGGFFQIHSYFKIPPTNTLIIWSLVKCQWTVFIMNYIYILYIYSKLFAQQKCQPLLRSHCITRTHVLWCHSSPGSPWIRTLLNMGTPKHWSTRSMDVFSLHQCSTRQRRVWKVEMKVRVGEGRLAPPSPPRLPPFWRPAGWGRCWGRASTDLALWVTQGRVE